MKTKFKYLALMATALLVGFTSCSNDDDGGKPENGGAPKSMLLKISRSNPSTYAEGAVQGNTDVLFSSGTLYFTDGSGVIKGTKSIGAATVLPTPDIDIADLDNNAGKVLTGIDGSVTKVYIVGNAAAGVLPAAPTSISQVENAVLQVQSQGTIGNVNLFGSSVLVAPVLPDPNWTCDVTLKPTVARIELTDMKAGGIITGFDVAGIFVDNYYSQAAVNGAVATLPSADLKDNSGFATALLANAAFTDDSPEYLAALRGSIYDWYGSTLSAAGAPATAVPLAGAVWGYNVFAAASPGSSVPRIIVRLTNITTSDDAAAGAPIYGGDDQYVTIRGFKDATNTPITKIEAGKVYSIGAGAFIFDQNNLTPVPNVEPIDVEVRVTLVQWSLESVTPEL